MALRLVSNDVCYLNVKKVSNEGSVTCKKQKIASGSARHLSRMSKRFQMSRFRGSRLRLATARQATQEPPSHEATARQGNQGSFG
jgi:hypothetical protein